MSARRALLPACTVGAIASLLLAVLLAAWPVLKPRPLTDAAIAGGCAPSGASFLAPLGAPAAATITYCASGDATRGALAMDLPARMLRSHDLRMAGYVDGTHVRAWLTRTAGGAPLELRLVAGEKWHSVLDQVPPGWRSSPLRVELFDDGTERTQWAGLAITPGAPLVAGPWSVALLVLSLMLALPAAAAVRAGSTQARQARFMPYLAAAALCTATLLLSLHYTHNGTVNEWHHPDESIPVKVLQGMHARGDVNTDFARADIPAYFHEFRYNFSGYLYASYLAVNAIEPEAFSSDERLLALLLDISRACTALTLVVCLLLLLRTLGPAHAVAGTLLVALVPQLYQDAHYARLEPMSTLLFTVAFALSTLRPTGSAGRIALVGGIAFLVGLLSTIKFTYVVCALLCVGAALPMVPASLPWPRRLSVLAGYGLVSLLGLVAGFCIGGPSIIADLPGYIEGIVALDRQYGGGHPPHGSSSPSATAQLVLMSGYYLATLGVPLLALHALGYAGSRLAPAKFFFLACLGLTFAAFLAQKAFFERNFSLFMPGLVVIAMVGVAELAASLQRRFPHALPVAHGAPQWVFIVFLAAVCAWAPTSVSSRLAGYFSREGNVEYQRAKDARFADAARRIGAVAVRDVPLHDAVVRAYPSHPECTLYLGHAYNDDWTGRYFARLPAYFRVHARIPSTFDEVPVSTLSVYHSPAYVLFYDARACLGVPGRDEAAAR